MTWIAMKITYPLLKLKYIPPFSLLQREDIVCYYYHIFLGNH
ncbi:hypothetical protein SELSPUOL_00615 [Selenomonas sputigena ATCC 35185]|uniref:Uncharacterized protein n=1 Tax=Selenomonas sputigena (strain ATCC 35185 / DSM 20758 / CCUG 44933 / VPI D19B-28) TaxID=546271 RepID=C9LT36_SELS3|nr:hypothetical protein SELSPUOL_00615 [Selenomonas sputigena ATCC 35185]